MKKLASYKLRLTVEIDAIPEEWEDSADDQPALARRVIEDYLNNPRKNLIRLFRDASVTGIEAR